MEVLLVIPVLVALLLALAVFAVTVYGLYLAFRANVIFGIIVIFVHPAPLIIGVVKLLFGVDLAQKIVKFVTEP